MRVTSGRLRGRPLAAPIGLAVRPTSDKLRQAMFNILEHGELIPGFGLDGARVIDLFAGTGALAIEALSRGARTALLIDNNATSRALIRRNVEALGLTGTTKIWRRDATKLGDAGRLAPFDLVFCDPPHGKGLGDKGLGEQALEAAAEEGWIAPEGIVVLQERAGVEPALAGGFAVIDRRRYGETDILIARLESKGDQ